MVITLTSEELRDILINTFNLSEGEVDNGWMERFASYQVNKLKKQLEKFGRWEHLKEPPSEAVELSHEIELIKKEFCLY